MYPLLPNKMSMERDSNGCCIMCILVIAIISKRIWECVQLEIKRRKKYLEEHGTNSYSHRPESNPFASKIICGDCNKVFARKGWRSSTGVDRKVWQCSERYKVKGVMGCANRHVEEETLIKAYLMAWNALVENREDLWSSGRNSCRARTSWKVIGRRSL